MKIFASVLCVWACAIGGLVWPGPAVVVHAAAPVAAGQDLLPQSGPPVGYLIGPQDVLKISVIDEGPEMQNQTAVVDAEGMISFWALKSIPAGGKTIRELQDRVAMMLADGFIKNPIVR